MICYSLSKSAYAALRDAIYWPQHGVLYFLDVACVHGTSVKELSFTSKEKKPTVTNRTNA
jgi:hypothetical protein